MTPATLILVILCVSAGTLAFRLSGPVLADRIGDTERAGRVTNDAAVLILCALAATSAVFDAHEFGGYARLAGVGVAGALAWRGAPLIAVVLVAAGVTAVLRLLGVA